MLDRRGRKEDICMSDFEPRDFLYLVNGMDIKPINEFIKAQGGYIRAGYEFIEEQGKSSALNEMFELMKTGDTLYIPTIKVFQNRKPYKILKQSLGILNNMDIKVISMAEPTYSYEPFITALNIVMTDIVVEYYEPLMKDKEKIAAEIKELEERKEDLQKRGGRPKKEIQAIEATALYRTNRFSIEEICGFTGLSKSSLFRALADYTDSVEENDIVI